MKNLENYGVQELSAKEAVSVDGGCPMCVFWGIVGGLIANGISASIDDPDSFWDGFTLQ